MSGKALGKYSSSEIHKIMTISVLAAMSDRAIHGRWLPVGQFGEYLHAKHPNGDTIQFGANALVKHLNKSFPHRSLKANEVQNVEGQKIMVFRHEYQPKGKGIYRFLYITGDTTKTSPKLPTYGNSLQWEASCCVPFSKRQLRSESTRRQLFCDATISPAPNMMPRKRRRITDERTNAPADAFEVGASSMPSIWTPHSPAVPDKLADDKGAEEGSSPLVSELAAEEEEGVGSTMPSIWTPPSPAVPELADHDKEAEEGPSSPVVTELAAEEEEGLPTTTTDNTVAQQAPVTYFDSPEAKQLFNPFQNESSTLAAINNQIEILQQANRSSSGYITLILNGREVNIEDNISQHQKWALRQKCQYIALALQLARENMSAWTWEHCCSIAVQRLAKQGITLATHARIVTKWYCHFRKHRKFALPVNSKDNLPPFLHANPDVCMRIKKYAKENLETLSIEMLSEYIHDKALPMLVHSTFAECDEGEEEDELSVSGAAVMLDLDSEEYQSKLRQILVPHGLTSVSPSTVYRWMIRLGFRYAARKKGYYVDGHEKPATIQYRWDFCKRYLTYEQRMHRWTQVTLAEAVVMEENGDVAKGSGYKQGNIIEYHVDTVNPEKLKETEFGGDLSIRFPVGAKPLVIFGHDECIFKQFTMPGKQWYGPSKETYIVPKDEGMGIMISAFQSREFGFGMQLTVQDLQRVNESRRGSTYMDKQAAHDTRKNVFKLELTTTPFVREFEYGANSEGYWTYQHMVLQLEDCVDVLKVLYPQYEFLFLFDHSCGHDRQKEDGLNVARMTKLYGGAQKRLRNTVIKQTQGYLGPYSPKLEPGNTQSMVFKADDIGPFWMTQTQREERRHDQLLDGQTVTRKYTREELIRHLKEKGITAKGKKEAIQTTAQEHNLPIQETKPKVIEGWENKAKGLLQVLWERGFVDESQLEKYTLNGTRDVFGLVQKYFSLKSLMSNCLDFEEEETLLQSMGREMGVLVDRTPKCHCELAGEGIEYSWGCAKNFYRRVALRRKKGKENFRSVVRESMSTDNVLTKARIRHFSRRARQYICAYFKIWISLNENNVGNVTHTAIPINIEKLVKLFKTHRCALDFDTSFCKASFVYSEQPYTQ